MQTFLKNFTFTALTFVGATAALTLNASAEQASFGHYDCTITTPGADAKQNLELLQIRNKPGMTFEVCYYRLNNGNPESQVAIAGHEAISKTISSEDAAIDATTFKLFPNSQLVTMDFYGAQKPGGFSTTVGDGWGTPYNVGDFTCEYTPDKTKSVCGGEE